MDAKELRIGNYVNLFDDGSFESVLRIDGENNRVMIHGEDYTDTWNISNTDPIPLTEEWLLKFGFEKWTWCDDCAFIPLFFGDSLYCRYYNDQWHIKRMKVGRDKEGVFGKTQGKYILPKGVIKHVHQLQNLYFSLTGKELTIKVHA